MEKKTHTQKRKKQKQNIISTKYLTTNTVSRLYHSCSCSCSRSFRVSVLLAPPRAQGVLLLHLGLDGAQVGAEVEDLLPHVVLQRLLGVQVVFEGEVEVFLAFL